MSNRTDKFKSLEIDDYLLIQMENDSTEALMRVLIRELQNAINSLSAAMLTIYLDPNLAPKHLEYLKNAEADSTTVGEQAEHVFTKIRTINQILAWLGNSVEISDVENKLND